MGTDPFAHLSKRRGLRASDLEEVVLDHTSLEDIPEGALSPFPNLQQLYVPFNRLTVLRHLEGNPRLKAIDARGNRLQTLDLKKQRFVTELLLGDNDFRDLETFIGMISHLRYLETLDLRGNPLTQHRGYHKILLSRFPDLKILDGTEISPHERRKHTVTVSETVPRKARTESVVDYLKTKPMSEADFVVEQKASAIRQEIESRRAQELEAATAVARQRKEAYEAASTIQNAKVPDHWDPLGQQARLLEAMKAPEPRRSSTRLFVKAATYRDRELITPGGAFMKQLNPCVPDLAIRRAANYAIVYPTFGPVGDEDPAFLLPRPSVRSFSSLS
jgi:hypothetical protein